MPNNPLPAIQQADYGQNIQKIAPNSKEYPYLLTQIHQPPHIYMSGRIDPSLFPIAIVGSRKMSEYGARAVQAIINGLAGLPICIVSGLAYGIDQAAHQAAIANGLQTIAVLGSGIDQASIYPQSNRQLAKKILNGHGALISEYAPGSPALDFHFPERNRIISGLSKAVVVIEASNKSGALITAKHALDQNRDIFAVPGSIFSKNCEGTISLLKKYAKPISSALDLINEYPDLQKFAAAASANTEQLLFDALPPMQSAILKLIGNEPINFDELLSQSKLPIQQINSALAMLELAGLISRVGAENFVKNLQPQNTAGNTHI